MTNRGYLSPSLLEPQSRGGDTAERGHSFQGQVMLCKIPAWLAQEGFTEVVSESIGDIEARFFVPGVGYVREFIEAKNHSVAPSEFWEEIQRFQQVDNGSPGTWRHFTIASAGISQGINPLAEALRRLQGPKGFYSQDSRVATNSWSDYVGIVQRLGRTERDARFVLEKVSLEPHWDAATFDGQAVFERRLTENLPEYGEIPARTLARVYPEMQALLRACAGRVISRPQLETCLRASLDPEHRPAPTPVWIETCARQADPLHGCSLCFDWSSFFAGDRRQFPAIEAWDRLVRDLEQTRDWILQYRSTRRIRLTGARRLSASLAIGSTFAATAGFSIEMNWRGEIWCTDAHPTVETPDYPLICRASAGEGSHLVVCIDILRDVSQEVERYLLQSDLSHAPRLWLHGPSAVASPEHANVAARAIKNAVSEALAGNRCNKMHLFFAGPSPLALFLGHRLNALAPVQCYEWVRSGEYVPTSRLFGMPT